MSSETSEMFEEFDPRSLVSLLLVADALKDGHVKNSGNVIKTLLNARRKELLLRQSESADPDDWRLIRFRGGSYAGRLWGEMVDSEDEAQIAYMQRWSRTPEFRNQLRHNYDMMVEVEDAIATALKNVEKKVKLAKDSARRKRATRGKRNASSTVTTRRKKKKKTEEEEVDAVEEDVEE